jgi:hypothetical protein
MQETETGTFTKHSIPLLKQLVAKRWKENNPICIETIPYEVSLPLFASLMETALLERVETE